MHVNSESFRNVLGQWPTGVTVVTTLVDGERHGMTASSFSSVSLDPPLVSVALASSAVTHDLVVGSGAFGISILAKDQAAIGKRFARYDPEQPNRFGEESWVTATTGAPVLADALGWLDCRVAHAYPGGDHTIFVGAVLAADTPRVTSPLLYHSRTWGQFADQLPVSVALLELGGSTDPLVFEADARPIDVRETCREAVLAAAGEVVAVRVVPGELAQANLLTALKSGVSAVEFDPAGQRALTATSVQSLLAGLDVQPALLGAPS